VVEAGSDEVVWTTCDYRIVGFSPDGEHMIGISGYGDGLGETFFAVLKTRTGAIVARYQNTDPRRPSFARQVVFEDDEHVLAVVYEKGRWGVVRCDFEGSCELPVEPVRGGEMASPAPYGLAAAG